MLKVMKYELRSEFNEVRFLLCAAFGLSILVGLILRFGELPLLPTVWFAVMLALVVLSVKAIFRNMTNRMFGTESYLTHTLPVDTWELLLGKAAAAWLFGILITAAASACWLLTLICISGFSDAGAASFVVMQSLPKLGEYYFSAFPNTIKYILLGIPAFIAISFLVILEFQFACIAGKQFGKYRAVAQTLIFVVLCMVEGIYNKSMSVGFLIVVVAAGGCFVGSHWLLRHKLSI